MLSQAQEIKTFSKIVFLRYSEIVLSPLERSRLLKIDVFASSGIMLSPMEVTTCSNIAFLRHSAIVLSPMDMSRILKNNVFASSEIVLPPMEIHTFSKIAFLRHSEIVFPPLESSRLLRICFRKLKTRALTSCNASQLASHQLQC